MPVRAGWVSSVSAAAPGRGFPPIGFILPCRNPARTSHDQTDAIRWKERSLNTDELADIPALAGTNEFTQLEVRFDKERAALWMVMRAHPRPTFNPDLLDEILRLGRLVRDSGLEVDFWVTASSCPGMFNAGGDLPLFARAIKDGDHAVLRSYARAAVDVVWELMTGFGIGALTVALVDGDALGGGYECALAHNFLVAEDGVTMAFPEMRFNHFAGMGAYSLIARRAGIPAADQLLVHGARRPVGWHAERGLVDTVAEPRDGHRVTLALLDRFRPRLNSVKALVRTRNRVLAITRAELMDITEDWAETAFTVGDRGVAYMERLVTLQNRRFVAS